MRVLIMSAAVLGAVVAYTPVTFAQTGSELAYCIDAGAGGAGGPKIDCKFQTMAQCEQAVKGQSGAKCIQNPKMATGGTKKN